MTLEVFDLVSVYLSKFKATRVIAYSYIHCPDIMLDQVLIPSCSSFSCCSCWVIALQKTLRSPSFEIRLG